MSKFVFVSRATRQIGAIAEEANGAAGQQLSQQSWETFEVPDGFVVPRMTDTLPEGWTPSPITPQEAA